jgi:hypothetical protein
VGEEIRKGFVILVFMIVIGVLCASDASGVATLFTYIPHVAVGGAGGVAYTSYLHVSDADGITPERQVTIYFFGDAGSPWFVNVEGVGKVSSISFALGAFQEKAFVLTGGGTKENGKDVINGKCVLVKLDGTVLASYDFKATRVY